MAEVSEAFYGGLSFISDLKHNPNAEEFETYYQLAKTNFDKNVKAASGADKQLFNKTITLREEAPGNKNVEVNKNYADCAKALSAVIATRKKIKGIPEAVYITGGTWPAAVDMFRIDGMGMKDYNSSDLILQYGNTYVGISLKKVVDPAAPPPTMINMSFQNILDMNDSQWLKKLEDDINIKRREYFARVIKDACNSGGPLETVCATGFASEKVNGQPALNSLDPSKPGDVKKIWDIKVPRLLPTYDNSVEMTLEQRLKPAKFYKDGKTHKPQVVMIPLINLKNTNELWQGVNSQLGPKAKTAFRDYVNRSLYSDKGSKKLNPLFADFLNIMNQKQVAEKLADALLDRTLKLKLMDNLDTWDRANFELFVTTGAGNAKKGEKPTIGTGTLKNVHSLMIACLALKHRRSVLEVDDSTTFTKAGAARLGFKLVKKGASFGQGDLPILNMELRYKGSFTSMPQFLGSMTKDFLAFTRTNKAIRTLRPLLRF
jgi:hypothetical protein